MFRLHLTKSENKFVLSQLEKSGVTTSINSDISFYTIDEYLVVACQKADSVLIKYLLERGANVNSFGSTFRLPLWWAVYSGVLGSVKLLLRHGAMVNFYDSESGLTPIELAVLQQDMQLVQLLLKSGAKQKVMRPPFYSTEDSIFICLKKKNFRMLKKLLKFGFNPNVKNSLGISALKWSINNHCLVAVKLLVNFGASMHAESDGYNIFRDVLNEDLSSVLQLFLDAGFDPLTNPIAGTHPILYCISVYAVDCACLLAINGAVYSGKIERLLIVLDSMKFYKLEALMSTLYADIFTISSILSAYSDYHFPYKNSSLPDSLVQCYSSTFLSVIRNKSSINSLQFICCMTILRSIGLCRIKFKQCQAILPYKIYNLLKSYCDDILTDLP